MMQCQSGSVRSGKVFKGLHFEQATLGSLELKIQPPAAVEISQWLFSGNN
jgi:hypothetical protein